MEAVEPNWIALIAFTAAWVATCVAGFFISGSLPLAMAPEQVRAGNGPMLVFFNTIVLVMLAAATLLYGLAELRWASMILAGGAVFLFAPAAIEVLPASIKDTKLGHWLMLGIVALGFVALISMDAFSAIRIYLTS